MDGRMEQRDREARKRGGMDGWIWRLMDEWMDG